MSALLANVSCVAVGGRAIVIEGAPGSGKSSLALALIDRGADLVGDDGILVESRGDLAMAAPPPNTAGKIEIRNVGIVDMPAREAPIALVIALDAEAERFPLSLDHRSIAGVAIPCLPFRPGDAIQALRAEYALEKHGLSLPLPASRGAKVKQ